MSEGKHYDTGKPRVDLVPVEAIIAAAEVFGYGAKKYTVGDIDGGNNWRNGIDWNKLYASTLRHLYAWQRGEDIDPESNHPHISHAICDIMMLSASVTNGYGKDTRWKPTPQTTSPLRTSQVAAQNQD